MDEAFLGTKVLHDLIERILAGWRVPAQDREDLLHDVLEGMIRWMRKESPATPDDVKNGARDIARKTAQKYWRKWGTRRKRDAGATGDADERSRFTVNAEEMDLLDVGKILGTINAMVASNELTPPQAAVLVALAEETTLIEHAVETGQSYDAVRKASERAQRKVVKHLASRGLLDVGIGKLLAAAAVAAAVAILLFLILDRREVVRLMSRSDTLANTRHVDAGAPPSPSALPSPSASAEREERAAAQKKHEQAEKELSLAQDAADNLEWRACLEHFAAASDLDRALDDHGLGRKCAIEEQKLLNAKGYKRAR